MSNTQLGFAIMIGAGLALITGFYMYTALQRPFMQNLKGFAAWVWDWIKTIAILLILFLIASGLAYMVGTTARWLFR